LTSYEDAFADALESLYGRSIHALVDVVTALNETGVRPAGGEDWTEDTFTRELARLAEGEDR
jgi:hypothetical protein